MPHSKSHDKTVLEVRDLSYAYGKIDVFNALSFSLDAGTIAFLVGANGIGKSTLFRCLARWCSPRTGEIILCDKVFDDSDRSLRANMVLFLMFPLFMMTSPPWSIFSLF